MNERDTSSYGDTPKYSKPISKQKKKSFGRTRRHVKPYEFDLEFKGQHRTGIMNVRNILTHGDTPM